MLIVIINNIVNNNDDEYITVYSSLLIMIFNNDDSIIRLLGMINNSLLINRLDWENIKDSNSESMIMVEIVVGLNSLLKCDSCSNDECLIFMIGVKDNTLSNSEGSGIRMKLRISSSSASYVSDAFMMTR